MPRKLNHALSKYALLEELNRVKEDLERAIESVLGEPTVQLPAHLSKMTDEEPSESGASNLRPEQIPDSDTSKLDPVFKRQLDDLLSRLEANHIPMKVYEAVRSSERQGYEYSIGRTTQLDRAPVTYAKPGSSPHLYGLAVDFVIDMDNLPEHLRGKVDGPWDGLLPPKDSKSQSTYDLNKPEVANYWKMLGELATASGLVWGGSWNFKDWGHVELKDWRDYLKSKETRVAEQPSKLTPRASRHLRALRKDALQVSVEPYQSDVSEAMKQIESKNSNYFSYTDLSGKTIQVKRVVLEAGDPGHFGMVRSDQPDTIFLSLDKIRNAVGAEKDPQKIQAILIEVLSHEMGHFKDNLQGGEGPAEAEAHKITQQFAGPEDWAVSILCEAASDLEKVGLFTDAALVDDLLKQSYVPSIVNPQDLAQSILRLVYHFAQKVKADNQGHYIDSIRSRLMTLSLLELTNKKKNPGAGIGAMLSILKNLLGGQTPEAIQQTMQIVFNGLEQMK